MAPTWAQLEPNWGPTWCNLCTFGRKLGVACATWSCVGHLVPKLGPRQHETPSKPNNIGNSSKKSKSSLTCRNFTPGHCFKRSVIDSKKMWKHTSENGRFEDFGLGPAMGPSWGQVAPSWRQVGPKLEPIGPSWAEVGLLLAEAGKLTPSRANVLDGNGTFGRFWTDLQNVQITTVPCTFWRRAQANMVPLQLKL